jgi:hypothetical protein
MAFTTAPALSTYETTKLPPVYDLDIPLGTAFPYAGLTNIIPLKDIHSDKIYGQTRYCISSKWVSSSSHDQYCRGMYVWEKSNGVVYYFVVIHEETVNTSKVYSSTNGTSWSAVNTLTTDATTPVRFTEFIDSTNIKKLVMVDGLEGYVFTSNAAGTKITDVDFPSPHVPFPVFLDGYLFLAKADTADIYNSDLNDPAVWTAGSFISAEMYPDNIQALVKINNYLVAIGAQSCEYFYDAANATASPLARLEGASAGFGTLFPNSIASSKDKIVMLANNNDGESCFKYIEGTRSQDIPCPFIQLWSSTSNALACRGSFIRQYGSLFYCFTFDGLSQAVPNSFMYALETQYWIKSSIYNGGVLPAFFTNEATSSAPTTFLAGHIYGTSSFNVLFGTLNPLSKYASPKSMDSFTGDSTDLKAIPQTIRTPSIDFGTVNRKFMYRFGIEFLSIIYNTTSSTEGFTVNIYDTGQTGPDSVTFSTYIYKDYSFPFVTQLGTFRQRAFEVTTTSSYPVRYNGFEVDINKGQQ